MQKIKLQWNFSYHVNVQVYHRVKHKIYCGRYSSRWTYKWIISRSALFTYYLTSVWYTRRSLSPEMRVGWMIRTIFHFDYFMTDYQQYSSLPLNSSWNRKRMSRIIGLFNICGSSWEYTLKHLLNELFSHKWAHRTNILSIFSLRLKENVWYLWQYRRLQHWWTDPTRMLFVDRVYFERNTYGLCEARRDMIDKCFASGACSRYRLVSKLMRL